MEETQEIWKPIKGYEGLYEVSNLGRVRSLTRVFVSKRGWINTWRGRTLIPLMKKGYCHIGLSKSNKVRHYRINRLVAEAFIPNPDNLPQVNHKDENPQNNRVDNLEWCSAKYNTNYGTALIRKAITRGRKVRCIENGNVYYSIGKAARENGTYSANVWKCCKGGRASANGLHFEFVEE